MASMRETALATRLHDVDLALTVSVNRGCQSNWLKCFFVVVSRLGDGLFWYLLMLALPAFYGNAGLQTSVRMGIAGLVCLVLYKLIKERTGRRRPCAVSQHIKRGTAPLDEFSFPSGHTLHAVAFSSLACSAHPELAPLLTPLVAAIAMSRVVLGLHYVSDVLVGAVLGLLVVEMLSQFC